MGHYLHRLPIRATEPARKSPSSAGPLIRSRPLVAALVLLAISSLAAMALERMGASLHDAVPPGWPASGCLGASMAPMGAQVAVGQASLCMADGGLDGSLDLENLEPTAQYVEWIAYFESPSLCSFGALVYQVYNFDRPCTLADLYGSQPHGVVQSVAATAADAQGILHSGGRLREINLTPHAQTWLLVSRPSWSPVQQPTYRPVQDNTREPVARAVFDVP